MDNYTYIACGINRELLQDHLSRAQEFIMS